MSTNQSSHPSADAEFARWDLAKGAVEGVHSLKEGSNNGSSSTGRPTSRSRPFSAPYVRSDRA